MPVSTPASNPTHDDGRDAGMLRAMTETKSKPKSLTLSDDDISISRPKARPASLGNVGGGPDVIGAGKGATDPDAAPMPKPAPSDPDGH